MSWSNTFLVRLLGMGVLPDLDSLARSRLTSKRDLRPLPSYMATQSTQVAHLTPLCARTSSFAWPPVLVMGAPQEAGCAAHREARCACSLTAACTTSVWVLKLLHRPAGSCALSSLLDLAAQMRQKCAVEQKRAVRMRRAINLSHHGHDCQTRQSAQSAQSVASLFHSWHTSCCPLDARQTAQAFTVEH